VAHRSGSIALVLALAACGRATDDLSTPEARARAVHAVVVSHLEHELAVLALLEAHQDNHDDAERAVSAYLSEHDTAINDLGQQRALLETEPLALARALAAARAQHAAAFEARLKLERERPALMARPAIREALSELDDL
jgi:hypothetical protein